MPNSGTTSPGRSPTRWAGVPAAERRAERRSLLLDAALELMGTEGWSGTTVRGICQSARLNPRYFYESFDDLDTLAVALYDRLVEQLGAVVFEAIESAGEDPVAQTRAALDSTVGFMVDDPRRSRVMYVEASGNKSLNQRRRQAGDELVAFIDAFAKQRSGRPAHEQVSTIGAAIAVGGTSELIVAWLAGRIDVSREELVDVATELFAGLGRAVERIQTTGTNASAGSPDASGTT